MQGYSWAPGSAGGRRRGRATGPPRRTARSPPRQSTAEVGRHTRDRCRRLGARVADPKFSPKHRERKACPAHVKMSLIHTTRQSVHGHVVSLVTPNNNSSTRIGRDMLCQSTSESASPVVRARTSKRCYATPSAQARTPPADENVLCPACPVVASLMVAGLLHDRQYCHPSLWGLALLNPSAHT